MSVQHMTKVSFWEIKPIRGENGRGQGALFVIPRSQLNCKDVQICNALERKSGEDPAQRLFFRNGVHSF